MLDIPVPVLLEFSEIGTTLQVDATSHWCFLLCAKIVLVLVLVLVLVCVCVCVIQ